MGDSITDTSKVAGTSKLTGTRAASTAPVLAKAGAPAAGKQPPSPPTIQPFKGKADILAWANDVMHQDLGLPGTFVHWWPSPLHPTHKPAHTPHPDLQSAAFQAWTNAGTEIFLLPALESFLKNMPKAAAARTAVWCVLLHESLHARHFTSAWKGSHPPSFTAGFRHEMKNYADSAKAMDNPPGKRIKDLLLDQDAADTFADIQDQSVAASKQMADYLANDPRMKGKPAAITIEAVCYDELKADLPAVLTGAKPALSFAEILTKTYGY